MNKKICKFCNKFKEVTMHKMGDSFGLPPYRIIWLCEECFKNAEKI